MMKTRKDFSKVKQLCNRLLTMFMLLAFCGMAMGQERSVSGTITDSKGEALPGVSVIVKGTSSGTLSDVDGKFTIKVPNNSATLRFSFVGYLTEEVAVGEQSSINVTMADDVRQLDEVVVVGYGVQKKSDLTGAVSSVSGENISRMPLAGVDQALQGRAAGVNVIQNSGMPGGNVTIQIRGVSSINGTDPIVIVDGVPGSLSNLSPSDIESVEVLKDASSAAIYGAAGGNGVILITTKKGKAGKTVTNFNYYRGLQQPWKRLELLNSQEFVDVANRITMINNADNIKNYVPYSDRPDTFANYDWQDEMFRTAVMENYDVSVSGGSEKSTFMVSGNYVRQEGIMRNSDYERYTMRINSDHKLNRWLKFGENVNYTQSGSQGYEEWEFQNEYNSPLIDVLRMYPFVAPYDANGEWGKTPDNSPNPKVKEDVTQKSRNRYALDGNIYFDMNLFKGFVFTTRMNGSSTFNVSDQFSKVYVYNPKVQNPINSVNKSIGQSYSWTWQNFANYNTTIASDHNVGLMAGMEAYSDVYKDISGVRYKLTSESPENQYFNASQDLTSADQMVKGGGNHNRNMAYFGRVNYDYKGLLLLTSNFRRDYSSKFGPSNRVGNFPSLSGGLKFSEFDFVKDLNVFSFGKLRASWGKTGANAPEGFRYSSLVQSDLSSLMYIYDGGTTLSQGSAAVQMSNPELHWESMVMSGFGVDLAFLNNKLTFTADYFVKSNEGMIYPKNLPAATGVFQNPSHRSELGGDARPLVNFGKIENKGIELGIGYKKMEGELKANFDLNLSVIRNKVIDIDKDTAYYGQVGVNLQNINIITEGIPVAQFYGYKTDGIFRESDAGLDKKGKVIIVNQPFTTKENGDTVYAQPKAKPGDLRYVDTNNDGTIDGKDRVVIGNPLPKFTFGFSCNFEYKGFDLNMMWQGSYGNQIFNGMKAEMMSQMIEKNKLKLVLDQYRSPIMDQNGNVLDPGNTNTDLFRLDPKGDNQHFGRVSDFFVEDGSYIRLKSIQLGYTIPTSLTDMVKIESLRFYIGAKNLITITNYSGFDPEISNNSVYTQGIDKAGNYPQSIMFLAGVNLKF